MKQKTVFWSLLLMVFCLPLMAGRQLKNFNEVLSALKEGGRVRAVIHYNRCRLFRDKKEIEKIPDAIGGMDLNTFEFFARESVKNPRGFISASKTVLIQHPGYGFVLNYVKLRIYEDNEIRIIAKYLSPDDHSVRMDETFVSRIADDANRGGIYFFVE